MTEIGEKLEISEFNYKVLRDDYRRIKKELEKSRKELEAMTFNYNELGNEYRELRKKYDDLNDYYDDLNDRYVKKLNAYNHTVVKMRETREDNEELAKENRGLVLKLCITFTLLLACCMFILVG